MSKSKTSDKKHNHSAGIHADRKIFDATRPFARESVAKSWWLVLSTFALMIALLTAAGLAPGWPLRLLFSIFSALVMVRAFITYHDFMHGAILRHSVAAKLLFNIYGAYMLTPPRSWKKSHNYHHGHVGQISTASAGAFPLITKKMWRQASRWQRFSYRTQRHPLIVLFSYLMVFAINICLLPLLRDPAKHWDSAFSLLVHFGGIALLWHYGGFHTAFFVMLLPMFIASLLGSYLFFAQHSFKRMHVMSPEAWTVYRAALESSSYMRLNKIMQWFTGNIGYHHIHHMNMHIPFYRLPEAMAAIPELQSPVTTTLSPKDIVACFQSCLWDEKSQRMISYREAKC